MKIERDAIRTDTDRLKATLLNGSAWSLISRFGQSGVTLAGTVILARILSPSDFGVVAISSALCLLMLVVAEGFIDYPILRNPDLDQNQLSSLVWTGLLFMAAAASMVFFLAPIIENAFGFDQLTEVLRATSLIYITQTIMVAGRAVLRRANQFRKIGLLVISSSLVYICTSIGLAITQWGIWSLVIGQIASSATLAIMLKRSAKLSLSWPRQFAPRESFHAGKLGMVKGALSWFRSNIDIVAIGFVASQSMVGNYSRAYNLTTQLKEPFGALDNPIRQALSQQRKSKLAYDRLFKTSCQIILLLSSQSSLFFAIHSSNIILLLFGSQWDDAAPLLAILVLSVPARIFSNLLDGDSIVGPAGMAPMVRRHLVLAILTGVGVAIASPYGAEGIAYSIVITAYIPLFIHSSDDGVVRGMMRILSLLRHSIIWGIIALAPLLMIKTIWIMHPITFFILSIGIFLMTTIVPLVFIIRASRIQTSTLAPRI